MDLSNLNTPGVPSPRSDSARLVVLIVLAVIVVAAFLYFNYQSTSDVGSEIPDSEIYDQVPQAVRIPGAKIDHGLLEGVMDSELRERVIKEKEAYLHLIQQASKLVTGDMDQLGVKKAVPENILSNTADFRGKPFEVKGNLQWVEKITDFDFELYRGALTSYEGHYYYFTVLDMNSEIQKGDVVKLQGFFFKRYSMTIPGEETRINDAIFLIGKRLIPSFFTMAKVEKLDIELLDNMVYDYDIQDMVKPFKDKPLYHLLSYVHNMDEEKYTSTEFVETLPLDFFKLTNQKRGTPVKVLGQIEWLVERNLGPEGENPIGPKTVYHGVMVNYRPGSGGFCYFISFDRPDWLRKKELVYINGIFYRNYAYRTRTERIQPACVVIVKGFEPFVLPEDNTLLYISYVIMGGAGLAVLFFFLHTFHDKKQNEIYREKFIKRKKKLLRATLNETKENDNDQTGSTEAD